MWASDNQSIFRKKGGTFITIGPVNTTRSQRSQIGKNGEVLNGEEKLVPSSEWH